jgi:hypothetical protein
MKRSPPSDEYVGRPPEGVRAGLGAARRSARALTNFGDWK